MESSKIDKCPCCGQRESAGQRVGSVGGAIIVMLIVLCMATPLVWLLRVLWSWALGL